MLYGDIQVDNAKDGITSTTFNLPGMAMASIQTEEEERKQVNIMREQLLM